ncbi:MAG: response regulator transcription factor [Elusimicrobia bacterium]|nr:response regulator transcription factor [Elusimicrobiota bacterium]
MAEEIDLMARAIVGWVSSRTSFDAAPREPLRSQGFQLVWTPDVAGLSEIAERTPFDALVMDLDDSKVEPFRLVQRVRRLKAARELPILFLSGRIDASSGVPQALRAGADDFLSKPAATGLLSARIEALLGTRQQFAKPESWAKHILRARDGRVILNLKSYQCQAQLGLEYEERRLTRKEFDVLATLLRRPNQLVRWEDFYGKGWKPHKLKAHSRTLVQHVMRLRQKLGPLGARIETLSGLGYRWRE